MELVYGLCFLLFVPLFFLTIVKIAKFFSYRLKMSNKTLTFVLVLVAFSVIFYLRWTSVANAYFMQNVPRRFGIIFDAGSTGSRMHVFRFQLSDKDSLWILEDSLFVSIKPGLSSYAHNPPEASKSLMPMLENAKTYIPEESWPETPVALKATAGLRLLPENIADSILSEVESLFKQYPFKLVENGVSVLEGDDEGLFSWFTVNYLNGNLNNMSKTVGVLDLGGGSTQITFYPPAIPSSKEHLVNVKLLDKSYHMYTHSYLGLGMMSARFQILGGMEKVSGEIEAQQIFSPCLPVGYNGSWNYRGRSHEIVHLNNSVDRLEFCKSKSKELLNKHDVKKPSLTNFTATSYFFDVALEENIISNSEEGNEITVDIFQKSAADACRHVNTSAPFRCIDLCHITTLLMDGYGLQPKQPLTLKKEIDGFEIAWPLGAIFEVYGKFNKVKRRETSLGP